METLKIKSPFFDKDNEYLKYFNKLDFITDDNILKQFNFMENNNLELFNNIIKYDNFLIYGDVQSGKTNNLIYISQKIIKDYNYNFILYLSGTKNDLMFQNQNRFYDAFRTMNKKKYIIVNSKGSTKHNQKFIRINIEKQNIIIMHSLKLPNSLENLFKTLKIFKEKIKVLIIDDEADEASLSKKTKESINLFLSFKNVKKISITASPFRNLYSSDYSYDYFYKLKSPKEYTGIEEFEKENYVVMSKNKKLEINFIIKPILEWMLSIINNKLNKSQLLINIFNGIDKHQEIYDYIFSFIMKLRSTKFVEKISFLLKVNLNCNEISSLSKTLLNSIYLSNSKSINDIKKLGYYQIIIGGFKLSRGLTYENLTHEVMINMGDKINAGTLIQRARWLGYRRNMLKIIKIYITEEIKAAFDELKDLISWTKKYQLVNRDYKKQFENRKYRMIKL